MKTSKINTIVVIAVALTAFGCGDMGPTEPGPDKIATNGPAEDVTLEDVREETAEAMDAAIELADQTRDQYVDELNAEINQIKQRLDTLRSKTQALGPQAREKWEQRIEQMKEEERALRQSLANVTDSAEDAWQDLAYGMSEARREMAQALQEAEAEFAKQKEQN